ncbi:hypothetical protein [Mesorhizobium carmichaelinearum]|uniref:hypothetical protein n=1 Tax=Mesorhizobium carmichaelinearum TaxID=1208188 RepID=UPI001FCEA8EA|nr:hypothetical protein [Mesorhizobium carmichaelinearum]
MQFAVVRSNAAGCEPNCPEWISAEGAIEAGTPAKLRQILKTLGRRHLPIIVNSPGGSVDAALQLGRIIRKNKLDVAVGATKFSGCQPGMSDCRANDGKGAAYLGTASDGGAMCNSACPLMFAGGVQRLVGRWAYLGVHQITTTFQRQQVYYRTTYRIVRGRKKIISSKVVSRTNAGTYKTYEMSKVVERKLSAYLREMGVGQGVLEVMKATPAGDIRQVALDDMTTMKLVTSEGTVDLLIWAGICRRNPAPANCREIPANAKPADVAAIDAKPAPSQPAQVSLSQPVKAAPTQPAEAALTQPVKAAPTQTANAAPTQPAKAPPPKPFWAAPGNGAQEMRFVLVRGSDALCNPDCPEWISAEGAITPQTPQELRHLLAMLGNRRLPVVISSRGGDLFSALTVGRLIRERRLDVAVARTNITGCDPAGGACSADNGAYVGLISDFGVECDSACALTLAGGVKRLVDPKARLSMYAMGQKRIVKAYLEEMAIDPGLFAALEQRSVERQLEPELMLRVGLTTGPQSVDLLTGSAICKSASKPDNCRALSSADAEAKTPPKL